MRSCCVRPLLPAIASRPASSSTRTRCRTHREITTTTRTAHTLTRPATSPRTTQSPSPSRQRHATRTCGRAAADAQTTRHPRGHASLETRVRACTHPAIAKLQSVCHPSRTTQRGTVVTRMSSILARVCSSVRVPPLVVGMFVPMVCHGLYPSSKGATAAHFDTLARVKQRVHTRLVCWQHQLASSSCPARNSSLHPGV